ncbi:MAG TPA: hypothetical protein VLT16_10350 [Candidatus Limnocylindrales bacterium]|nr:hypothetical protein [Candidatus Limnocylindrales bacterium]
MKRIHVVVGILLLGFAGAGLLRGAKDKPAAAPHAMYEYDPAAQTTITGTIEKVDEYRCPVTGTVGSHITVKAATGLVEVHLAPATYLKYLDFTFRPGEEVKVTGARILMDGKPALMALSVVVGRETLTFRDNKGKPLW